MQSYKQWQSASKGEREKWQSTEVKNWVKVSKWGIGWGKYHPAVTKLKIRWKSQSSELKVSEKWEIRWVRKPAATFHPTVRRSFHRAGKLEKLLFTIYVWTPPWRFFLCKVFAHNLCPDPSMAVFLQSFCSQYMSRPLHGALLLVCSQDASGFLHLGVASYPSPSSHILTQNMCPSETDSYLENISMFSESESLWCVLQTGFGDSK